MKKTFWTMATFGLLATCITGCGGGKDNAGDICNRLQECNDLSMVNETTVAQCTTDANKQLSSIPSSQRDAVDKTVDRCLALSDCSSFSSCVSALINYGPTSTY